VRRRRNIDAHGRRGKEKKTCEYKNTKRVFFSQSPWTPWVKTPSTASFQVATHTKE
jgi:hypothetical protein